MRIFLTIALVLAAAVCAQTPPSGADSVVATIDGKPVSAAEIQALFRVIGPQAQQTARQNPKSFLQQYAMLKRLSEEAEKNKLDQKSPYKEAVAASRMQILYQAQVQETYEQTAVRAEEEKKFYEDNKDRFAQARVKVIYIPFSANPPAQTDPNAKKVLTEAEAKARAADLVKQIRAGADFIKLVKEHSQDPTSVAKDGDFPVISKADKIPEDIKAAVFALKQGEVSAPVRAPNGFYIFRGEEITTKAFEQARGEIYNELKLARLKESLDAIQKSVQVKIENESFFTQVQTVR